MSLSPNPSVSLSPPLPSEVPRHEHAHGRCPIVDPEEGPITHVFCPKQEDDSRSPCPALNALANHGYLPRNGRNITCHDLVRGMETAYGCSRVLSNFITYAGITLLGQIPPISLSDLARHNHIEHNASLVHSDVDEEDEAEYAPTEVDEELLEELVKDSHDHRSFSIPDLSRARVRRESWCCHAIDEMHKEIAKGEVAMIMGIFGSPSLSPSCSGSNSSGASPRNSPLGLSLPLPKIEEDVPLSRSPKAMPSELESGSTYESRGGSGSDNSNSSDSAHVHTLTPTHQHHHRTFFHKKEHPEQYFTIPLEQATTWLREERLPDGWQPQKCGMSDLFENLTSVRRAMRFFQKELSEKRKKKGKSGGGSHGDDVGDGLKAVERLERETKHDLNGEQDQQEQHWYHPRSHLKLKELEGFHIHRNKPVDA